MCEVGGGAAMMPVTVRGVPSSVCSVCPTGSSVPKKVAASAGVSTMLFGALSAVAGSPCSISNEKTSKSDGSA